MRRFLVGVVLVMALLSFGQWMLPSNNTASASDVEISGTFKGIGVIDGRLVLILESDGKEINVLAPLWILRTVNFKLYAGEELKVSGEKLTWGDINVIVPYGFVYKGKEYDMPRFYAREGLHLYPYGMRARTPVRAFPPAFKGRYHDDWDWNWDQDWDYYHHYYHHERPFRRVPAPGGRMRTPMPGYGRGW